MLEFQWTKIGTPMIFVATCCVQLLAIDIAILHQTTRKTSNVGVGRGVKGYWLLVSSTSSAEAAGCKEVKPARPAELTKNPILKQSNCFCHTAVRSNKRESYLRQQYCGIIGLWAIQTEALSVLYGCLNQLIQFSIKSPQECSDAKFCIHGVVWSYSS